MEDDDGVKRNLLPPFPVDDSTLDLLWLAIHPGPEAPRTSLYDFLSWMSEMGGSDVKAVEKEEAGILFMRDQQYTDFDVITALIKEVRRLRTDLFEAKIKRDPYEWRQYVAWRQQNKPLTPDSWKEYLASQRDEDASPDS